MMTSTVFIYASCRLVIGIDEMAEVQRKLLKDDESASELTLKCHVEGNPEPTVIWTRNKERYNVNNYTVATAKK